MWSILLANKRLAAEIVGALLLILSMAWWHHAAVKKGEAIILRQDAELMAAAAKKNNDEFIRRDKLNREISNEYEAQLQESHAANDDLKSLLAHSRVCLNAPSGRTVPAAPKASTGTPAAPESEGLQPSVGEDLAGLISECQANTDKLMALQGWFNR